METPYQPTAKFNAGLLTTERLHKLLQDCNDFSRMVAPTSIGLSYLSLWVGSIDDFFKEISGKISDDDVVFFNKQFDSLGFSVLKNVWNGRIIDSTLYNKKIEMVRNLEVSLRRAADKKGLLIPDNQDAGNILGADN